MSAEWSTNSNQSQSSSSLFSGFGNLLRNSFGSLPKLFIHAHTEGKQQPSLDGLSFSLSSPQLVPASSSQISQQRIPKRRTQPSKLPFPGIYKDVDKGSKDVLTMQHNGSGLSIEWEKNISGDGRERQFSTSHTFTYRYSEGTNPQMIAGMSGLQGMQMPAGPPVTMFGSSVKHIEGNNSQMVAMVDWTSNTMTGICFKRLTECLNGKLQFMIAPNTQGVGSAADRWSWNMEYKGSDWGAEVMMEGMCNVMAVSFLKSITLTLALGSELLFVRRDRKSEVSYAGRWKPNGQDTIATTINTYQKMFTLGYSRRLSSWLSTATELHYNYGQNEAAFIAGYSCQLEQTGAQLKGQIDSEGKIAVVIESPLDIPFVTVALSGIVNHRSGENKFGINFRFMAPSEEQNQLQMQLMQQMGGNMSGTI